MNSNPGEKLGANEVVKVGATGASAMRCVADVMTHEVLSLTPQHNFADAVNLIANRHFRHFVVVEQDRVVGVVSDRDILRGLARTDNWQRKEICEFMSVDPITVAPDMALSAAISKMLAHRINCLPVIEANGKPCGILTTSDLLKSYETLLRSLEERQCL
ncbi:MAG TPA: CBS domain-containing protein [Candidatus Binatia bacterium]